MKKIQHILFCILLAVILLSGCAFSASAESYTHWYTRNGSRSVTLTNVYKADFEINSFTLGMDNSLDGLNDLACYARDTYVLCGNLSKILVLDSRYKLKSIFTAFDKDGKNVDFTGATGIFVDGDTVLIADADHERVLVCDKTGLVTFQIGLPDATVIPDTFVYRPIKVVKDQRGYIYIVSEGSYYGALLFDSNYNFLGFYGANEAKAGLKDALSNLWNRFFATNTQLSKQSKTLPYQFSNFCVGGDGFLYTSTGATDLWKVGTGQLVKLSPGGGNVLYRYNTLGKASLADGFNFGESNFLKTQNTNRMQSFCDLYVDDNSFIYAVDKTYGLIYLYDSRCNLISAFGGGFGSGDTLGTFSNPTAITMCGNDLLVSDSVKCSVTVFKLTDFGANLIAAQKLRIDGNYGESLELWQSVMRADPNCQMAYIGLANAYFELGDNDEAILYARLGEDYATYSQIYESVAKEFIRENVVWIVLIIFIVITSCVLLSVLIKKKTYSYADASTNVKKLYIPLRIIPHPVESFNDLKYKKYASPLIGIIIAVVYYITEILTVTHGGFLFSAFDTSSFNALFVFAKTAGLIGLWSLVNWAVCSLLEGKGSLNEVFCVTTYSIIPLIFKNILFLILSNILPLSANVVLSIMDVIALMLVAFLLIIGTITVHEYSFSKFIFTSILTVLGMILVVFIAFVMAILIQQFFNFFVSVYTEIAYR